MTYAASEQSTHSGKPNELYRFVGTYGNFYYTSGPETVEFQADDEDAPNAYEPITLRRSEITIGTMDDDGTDLTIEMPVKTEIVKLYGFKVAPPELFLTIFRFHSGDEDFATYWRGDINNITAARGFATLRSASILSQTSAAEFPNVFFQRPCNHILFDPRCGQVEADWTVETEVAAVEGRIVTVAGALVATNGDISEMLVGGELKLASGERRMIVASADNHAGRLVTVNFPFAQIEVGDAVSLVVGCNHEWTGDCATRFDNQKQHGGFNHIPPENPFASGIDPSVTPIADNTCLPPTPVAFDGWWLKFRVDFWAGECGPDTFASTFLDCDSDGNGTLDSTIDTSNVGDGSPGNAVQLEFLTGEHFAQGFEYTLWQEDAWTNFPTDVTLSERLYVLRLQFPSGSMSCGFNRYARVSIKRWTDPDFTVIAPAWGNTIPLQNDTDFDIEGLWPRDYGFIF